MKASRLSARAFLDEDQWRAVAALSAELEELAPNTNTDHALRQACRDIREAYVRALSHASPPAAKTWRGFYELAVFVIGKTANVADAASLRAFVAENADLALVDDGDRFDFDQKTLVG
jgi:hypothetical protein